MSSQDEMLQPTRRVTAATMAEAFIHTTKTYAGRTALRTKDGSRSWTWAAVGERAAAVAGGLERIGLRRGDTVAIMLSNRPEFHVVDLALTALGCTTFSIYQTFAANEIEYVVGDAGARVVISETSSLEKLRSADLPDIETFVVVDGDGDGMLSLAEVEASGSGFDLEARAREVTPDDVLTLIYTSGTTGPPKGVQLTHRNLIALVRSVEQVVDLPDEARVISWLPAAHIAERAAHHYLPAAVGYTITCCPDYREVMALMPSVRPSVFFAVPRIWEKLKAGLESMLAGLPAEQGEKARAALADATRKVKLEQARESVPADLARRVAAADEELFSQLRAHLGLDQLVACFVGSAPTPVEVLEFFHAIGIEVCELWGMSESCGWGTANVPGNVHIGTVGPPAPGVEVELAADGEVLLRGAVVMSGYRNQPEKTAETIDSDGWLHTGDIGQFDPDGFLRIVDRKKELIINAAGKNMSPANIEAEIKSASPLIGQACAIGDMRPYNTALIVLDPEYAPVWAEKNGLDGREYSELASDDRVKAAVQEAIDRANAKLARVEQIKKFTIVGQDWQPGGDELTPTMKLKRKPIAAKYESEIDAMYG